MTPDVQLRNVRAIGPFSFRWPDATEEFESGWEADLIVDGEQHRFRHGLGGRLVYGRWRVHTVTWLDNNVEVEGVEADDYPMSRALLSGVRRADNRLARAREEVSTDYEGFAVVNHRQEIDAKWSRTSLAVKIAEGDLASWGRHAWIRHSLRAHPKAPPGFTNPPAQPATLPTPPPSNAQAVAAALLDHGRSLAAAVGGATVRFTNDDRANDFIHENPFAFLVAVISDQGMVAERAWAIPYELRQRLGHLDPALIGKDAGPVSAVFAQPPKLHRFINDVAGWVTEAGRIVTERYGGDAGLIWSGKPSAAELRRRFDDFPGIGQKKAAMAVEILERDLHVPLTELAGSDIAYDVHVRRVFLRTGLAERDDVTHMVAMARALRPERPGELDDPAWDIGRRWCHPGTPDCPTCPLLRACPRHIDRARVVRGA